MLFGPKSTIPQTDGSPPVTELCIVYVYAAPIGAVSNDTNPVVYLSVAVITELPPPETVHGIAVPLLTTCITAVPTE